MSLIPFERELNVKDYTVRVRDFRNEKKTPVFSEIRVYDRAGREIPELYRVVYAQDRVETINELKRAIKAHLNAAKKRKGSG